MKRILYFIVFYFFALQQNMAAIQPGDSLLGKISLLPTEEKISYLLRQLYLVKTISGTDAIEYAQEGLKWAEEQGRTEDMARLTNFIGNTFFETGNFSEAQIYFQKALKLTMQISNKPEVANIMQKIGIVFFNLGDYKKALVYFEYSLKVYQELDFPSREAEIYTNIGSIYYHWNDFIKAYEQFDQAYAIYNDLENIRLRFSVQYLKANALFKAGKNDEVIAILDPLVDESKLKIDPVEISKVYNLLGSVYLEQQKLEEAERFFLLSYDVVGQSGDNVLVAQTFLNLGVTNIALGRFPLALKYLEKARTIAETEQFPIIMIDILEAYYEFYYLQDKPSQALAYYQKYVQQKDSLFSGKGVVLSEQQGRESGKRALLIMRKQLLETRFENYVLWATVAFLCVLLIWTFVLIKRRNDRLRKITRGMLNK